MVVKRVELMVEWLEQTKVERKAATLANLLAGLLVDSLVV